MRHDLHRRLVIAGDGALLERDTRGNNETVVRQAGTALEPDGLGGRIDRRATIVDDADAIAIRQRVVSVSLAT